MLEQFRAAKVAELLKLAKLAAEDELPEPYAGFKPSFSYALLQKKGIAVIAEYKRASPSKGPINLALSPEETAACYAQAGATALSVLTEETHFQGRLEFLERMSHVRLPLLRKDFIFDPLQVAETAATPASALLLIARMFKSAAELSVLIDMTAELGMEPVTEVFDEADLGLARQAGAWIIQVNNRDLDTLKVDPGVSRRLIRERGVEELWISASGIRTAEDLKQLKGLGFNAALVGSALMAEKDPGLALRKLLLGA